MRQRNDSGSVLHVSAWPTEQDPDRRPFLAGPGEEKDFPELLAGFTPLDETPAPDAAPAAADTPARPKTTRSSKSAASAAEGSDA